MTTLFLKLAFLLLSALPIQAGGYPFPVAGATAAPPSYSYNGCAYFGASEWTNQVITSTGVDANSATIISQLPTGSFNQGNTTGNEQINLGTSSTTTYSIGTVSGGHSPAFYNASVMPWINGWYIEATSDHHGLVLLTDTCAFYDSYGFTWTAPSGPLKAYDGELWQLNSTFASQYVAGRNASGDSGLPTLTGTDFGEDASSMAILHPIYLRGPTGTGLSQNGYIKPAQHQSDIADTGCSGAACAHPLHIGDRLRLHSSFNCAAYGPQSQLVCVQLKNYGAIMIDQASGWTLMFGCTASATSGGCSTSLNDPWNFSGDLTTFLSALSISNFDVLDETLQGGIQCKSGTTLGTTCF